MQHEPTKSRPTAWRARWAAVGAAVAVIVGGGGWFVATAAPSEPGSTFVPIEPTRVMDTRAECPDGQFLQLFADQVGLSFNMVGSANGCNLQPDTVPVGATAVVLNVTAVRPTGAGYVSIRPWTSNAEDYVPPTVSHLNFEAGEVAPNSVTVGLPVDGEWAGVIDVYYGSRCQCPLEELPVLSPHNIDILIDVMGYYVGSAPMVVPE
jgi:hypothetical protein